MSPTSRSDSQDASGSTKVRVLTLGCRLNQAESEEMHRTLVASGLTPCGEDEDADLTVVNTCTVTMDASRSSRKLIRRAADSGGRVIVTGCYAVAAPGDCRIPGVVSVVPNKDKQDLARSLLALDGVRCADPPPALPAPRTVRGSFAVQTGCDVGCAFCVIPSTRGGLSSRDPDEVVAGIREQVRAGVREVALTGVHLGRYGVDRGDTSGLAGLLRRILREVPELPWLRLSSIEADSVTDELLDVVGGESRVCRHLHIPLQAGDDMILAKMGRPYDTASYLSVLGRVRETLGPDVGITADVMVGFPGETESRFAGGLRFVAESGLTGLHVFRYSPRPGTRAATMADQVDEGAKKERSRRMRDAGRLLTESLARRFLGRRLDVLVERAGEADPVSGRVSPRLTGTAGNYLKAESSGPAGLVGRVVHLLVDHADGHGVSGRWEQAQEAPSSPSDPPDGRFDPGHGAIHLTGCETKGDVP